MKYFDWLTLVISRVTYGKVLIAFLFLASVYWTVSALKRFAKSIYKNLCIKPRGNGRKIVNQYELLRPLARSFRAFFFFAQRLNVIHTARYTHGSGHAVAPV